MIVSLFVEDLLNSRAVQLFTRQRIEPVLSDFAVAEFASSVARRVRTGDLSKSDAEIVFGDLDRWATRHERIETTSADIRAAEALIRRLDLPLRTPDALNVALARRVDAALATFDRQMAQAARHVALDVVE